MNKAIVLLLSCIFVAALGEKILGHRSATNFPTTWKLGKSADDAHKLNFIVALKKQNLDVLEEKFWAVSDPQSPEYRNFMKIEEIDAIVNPPQESVDKVVAWLKSAKIDKYTNLGTAIEVTCSVHAAKQLFKTHFVEFEHKESGVKIVRQFGHFSVPAELEDIVVLVSGLSEFPVPKIGVKRQSQKRGLSQTAPSIAPQSIQSYYSVGSAVSSGGNNSVGVVEFEQQYFAPSDLSAFATSFNVNCPPVTAAHTIGSNDPTNPQLEATLDIQYVLGVAQGAIGWFWIENTNIWLYGFATHMYKTTPAPYVASISYGWNEQMQCESGIGSAECQQLGVNSNQYVALVNQQFQMIGLRGISLICASGDSGANGRTDPYCNENHLNPVFPAASPYITSCGATQIDATINNGGNSVPNPPSGCSGVLCTGSGGYEEAVSYAQANFASGGGFSNVASVPSYQSAATKAYLASGVTLPPSGYYNANGRGFPDIAAFGSNVLISSQGSIEQVGGTSCASPIFAGVITLLNQYVIANTGKPLGFLNPLLYQMASASPSTFHDITVGDNICTESGCSSSCQGFKATKGWDPVTGLGSPNYAAMKSYLKVLFNIESDN